MEVWNGDREFDSCGVDETGLEPSKACRVRRSLLVIIHTYIVVYSSCTDNTIVVFAWY